MGLSENKKRPSCCWLAYSVPRRGLAGTSAPVNSRFLKLAPLKGKWSAGTGTMQLCAFLLSNGPLLGSWVLALL